MKQLVIHNFTNTDLRDDYRKKCTDIGHGRRSEKLYYVVFGEELASDTRLNFAKCLDIDSIVVLTNKSMSKRENGALYLNKNAYFTKYTRPLILTKSD